MFGGGYSVSSRNNRKLRSRQSNLSPFNAKNQPKDGTPLITKKVVPSINPKRSLSKRNENKAVGLVYVGLICTGLIIAYLIDKI